MLECVINMPANGPHKVYSLVELGQRQKNFKQYTFTTAFQWHGHRYYLVAENLRACHGQVDSGSCLHEAEEGVGAESTPRIEIWLEPGKEGWQWSLRQVKKSNGHLDQRGPAITCDRGLLI